MANLNDHEQTRLATAALLVAFAKTLEQTHPGFTAKFDQNLEAAYQALSDFPSDTLKATESVGWAHELLRKP
jgi:hypothetical protein